MNKFKNGDRVRIRKWDDLVSEFGLDEDGDVSCNGCFNKEMRHLCGREATICSVRDKEFELTDWSDASGDLYWCFTVDMLEPVNKKEGKKIVITTDGKTTTARIFDGKRVVKTTTARCAPEDEFDFKTGAKIAFDRLVESDLWKRFEKNEVCVAVTKDNVKAFLRECEKRGYKWGTGALATDFNPFDVIGKRELFLKFSNERLLYSTGVGDLDQEIYKASRFAEIADKSKYSVGEFVRVVDNQSNCFPVGTIVEIKKIIFGDLLVSFGLLRTGTGKYGFGSQALSPDEVEKIE